MDGHRPHAGPFRWMTRWSSWLLATFLASAPVVAQNAKSDVDSVVSQPAALVVPTEVEVEALSQNIRDDQTLDETIRQTASESLQQIVATLKQIQELQQSRAALAKSASDAANATRAAKASLDQPSEPPSIDITAWSPIAEVRARKTEAATELATAREAKANLESKIRDRDVRRTELESIILETNSELKKLESETPAKPSEGEDPRFSRAKRWDHATAIVLVRERLQTLRQEQKTYAAEVELIPARLELAQRDVTAKEIASRQLSETLALRRDTIVTDALAAHRAEFGQLITDPTVGILAMEEHWLEIVRASAQLQQTHVEAQSEADALRREFMDRKADVEKDLKSGGELRSALGLKLQRIRSDLPAPSGIRGEISGVQRKIDSAQILQGEIESRMEELAGGGFLQGRVDSTTVQPSADKEIQLLRDMTTDVDEYWNELIKLKALHEDRYKTVTEYRDLIDRNVLWIRSAQPYALSDLPLAWQAFQELVAPRNLPVLGTTIWNELRRRPLIWCSWIVALTLLFSMSPRMRRQLAAHGEDANRRGQTKMRPTWSALALTVVLSLPVVVLFAVPGWRIRGTPDVTIYVLSIGNALMEAAAFALPLELLRQICRPGGLANSHFGWSETATRSLRTNLRFLLDLGFPLVLVWAATETIGHVRVQSSLGRLMFALLMLVFAGVFWSAMNPRKGILNTWIVKHPDGWIDQLRYLWRPVITLIPLLLGVVCLAGYSYATRALSMELYATLWLSISMVLAAGLLRRWVIINRRQMLRLQAQHRAVEREKQEETPAALFVEETELDVTQVNTQTQRLINASLIVVGVVGVAWIWASVLPAVEYLERITLVPGDEGQPPFLTLANLVLSLPIVVLTFVASRNLPGLLESVVLQRLPIDNAARYAITSLASYALIVVGVMFSANTLGIRWDSIQWLVAALGVGLGFGLQEIFANFISGIILLFEQPIRVGDVVTLGDTTGVVTKIRIRATTVTNWDRQELIVPNKDLITGRLINWTLTDSTNRIVIKVGIAYGADTRKACSILEQICRDHPNISNDPAAVVTFEGFGDSTLDLVLRCYMTSLDGRLGTIHDLHTEINDRFAEANLEIAFPQRDLHLRTLPPDLLSAISRRKSAA